MPSPLLPTSYPSAALTWQGRPTWRILATQFGNGVTFLHTWAAWQSDEQRCEQLHFIAVVESAVDTDTLLATVPAQHLQGAQTLCAQLYGLLPGVHRLSFDQERVHLTLWVGDAHTMLRQQNSTVDALLVPASYPSDAHSIKAIARHCQRGTILEAPKLEAPLLKALESAGFKANSAAAASVAYYEPHWEPRKRTTAIETRTTAGTALVVGAGLAGSAIAHSLAVRGWQVTVLGKGAEPADGASGLPAGLFCPHVSPDDSVLSRLSRSGVRMTLQRLRDLCHEGQDWGHSGVLEHCTDGGTGLPSHWQDGIGAQWSHAASTEQLQSVGLDADTVACWHEQAGWVVPTKLVMAQLQHPNIQFIGNKHVASVQFSTSGKWQALNADGHIVTQADLAILACGPATNSLLLDHITWPLQALRGQVTWGLHTPGNLTALPPFPVNGNGNLVTHIPFAQGSGWVMGSTFERDVDTMPISAEDQIAAHAVNFEKLSTLLPRSAGPLLPWFTPGDERCQPTWGRVRVASHDRLPIAGPIAAPAPHLWACTAMGARGLTLSVLCAELIAAQLHGEPLPLDAKLALHLGTERLSARN